MTTPAFIETYTGRRFYSLEPRVVDVCIQDIAHGTANQCRYTGHTREFYSIAEHSILVAKLVKRWGGTPIEQLWGLLHDADEAYLPDLPTPFKHDPVFGALYRAAGQRIQKVIAKAFGLPEEEPSLVKRADRVMLATEVRDLMPGVPENWEYCLTELPDEDTSVATPMAPRDAEFYLRHLYTELLWEIDRHADRHAAE